MVKPKFEFKSHFSNDTQTIFIYDNNKVYNINLVDGSVQRFSGKMKMATEIEIVGLKEGLMGFRTKWQKRLENKKEEHKKVLEIMKIASNKNIIPLEQLYSECNKNLGLDQQQTNNAVEKLKSYGACFEPKRGFLQLL